MTTALTARLSHLFSHGPRLLAAGLLLSLPGWSGCFTSEPATITAEQISNPTAGARGYQIAVPPGYSAVNLPEYLPHVPFTQEWLATEEAAPFSGIAQTQALELKLLADHLLYRRPNYRAYFSISGEDVLLFPTAQADQPAPSPFLVFSLITVRNATGTPAFPTLGKGNLNAFGNWMAGSLKEQATEIRVETRSLMGRDWLWLSARLSDPLLITEDSEKAPVAAPETAPRPAPSPGSAGNNTPESWNLLYVATLSSGTYLYAIQGWSHPEDTKALVDAVEEMILSLDLAPAKN